MAPVAVVVMSFVVVPVESVAVYAVVAVVTMMALVVERFFMFK